MIIPRERYRQKAYAFILIMLNNPDFLNTIGTLKAIKFSELKREELGRDYNFVSIVKDLQEIYDNLNFVFENEKSIKLSNSSEQHISDAAKKISVLISQIQAFYLKGNEPNAANQYRTIINDTAQLVQKDREHIQPLLDRINSRNIDPKKIKKDVKELNDIKTDLNELVKNFSSTIDSTKKDIENSIMKKVGDKLGAKGATISSKVFQTQADSHKDASLWWLLAAIISVLITINFIVFTITKNLLPLDEKDNMRLLQLAISKITLLSVFYVMIHQTIKNYKINRHLYILNKHRQLSLEVYPFMTDATNSQEHSNIILTQAAKAIFEPGTTGYVPDDDNNPNPINLTQIIDKISDRK